MDARDWRNAGLLQFASGNYTTAIASFLRARARGETGANFHVELALAFWKAGDEQSALRELAAAQGIEKTFEVCATVAKIMAETGDHEASVKWISRAIELQPDRRELRFHRAMQMLLAGDWLGGWQEYEARQEFLPMDFPATGVPLWKGEPLGGKFLWVTYEQGMGDQIMFMRYLPWLRAKASSLYFDSHPELADFSFAMDIPTRTMAGAGSYKVPVHEATQRRPDYMIPLMSLPALHKTTPDNMLPPYPGFRIASKPYTVNLGGEPGKKKIGLVWGGNKNHPNDALRSMPFNELVPLCGDDRCEFYSFQANDRGEDIEKCGAELLVHRMSLRGWMHTCAALKHMDMLVSVDTACAHMAASLGIKTVMMLAQDCDYRWGGTGETTPWYPAMTLVRQERRGDWRGVVRKVMTELEELHG